MSDDKIVIDGVECEMSVDPENEENVRIALRSGRDIYVCLRPKRKQTGIDAPSPIDGLVHTSVWGKLHDLESRIQRLEGKVVE